MRQDELEIIFNDICADLMACKKSLQLYPPGHPRIGESVTSAKRDLLSYEQKRGRPFNLQSSVDGDAAAGVKLPESRRRLVHILKLNLIEKLTILPTVPESEIVQFLGDLDDGTSTKAPATVAADDDPLLLHAASWGGVHISFFCLQEIPDEIATSAALSSRLAGVECVKSLQSDIDRLPERARDEIRDVINHPAFLLRVAALRKTFAKHALASNVETKREEVELISEVIRAAMPTAAARAEDCDAAAVISTIESFMRFVENNAEVLSGNIDSYPGIGQIRAIRGHVHEAAQSDVGLLPRIEQFQVQKERLRFLFQTAFRERDAADPNADLSPEARPCALAEALNQAEQSIGRKASGELRTHEVEKRERTLEEEVAATRYRLADFVRQIDKDDFPTIFLYAVLDFLSRRDLQDAVRQTWSNVLHTLLTAAQDIGFLKRAIRELCEFLRESALPDAEKLLFDLLGGIEQKHDLVVLMEQAILPEGGVGLVQDVLRVLARKDLRKTVPLLARMRQSRVDSIRDAAEAVMLSIAANPEALCRWAFDDPVSLTRESMLDQVLRKVPTERLGEAFRIFFSRCEHLEAIRFIASLPAGVAGVEQILFAAMNHADDKTRPHAIEALKRFPTPVTVATLKGLIRLNNDRAILCATDVEAAVRALAEIDHPDARALFDEILNSRQVFTYTYLKEIRRAVRRAVGERTVG